MLKIFKRIDVFKEEMYTFSTDRNHKTNQKKYTRYHGSILGGIFTFFCGLVTLSYLTIEINKMMANSYDNYNT